MNPFAPPTAADDVAAGTPAAAPPTPPPEVICARSRRRLLLIAALVIAGVGLGVLVAGDQYAHVRGRTGIPLPGLAPEAGDAALAKATEEAFEPLTWEMLGRVDVTTEPATPPDDLLALAGRPVVIQGFMVPLDAGATTIDFVLVPDISRCWFCTTPDQQRSLYCRAILGPIEAKYDRPVRVRGVLDVEPVFVDGALHSLTRLRAVRVDAL